MKLISLVVSICSTTIILCAIKEYSEFFAIKISGILYIMLGILLSFNLDGFISVLWIANSNELLSGLVYASIFYLIALFLNDKIPSSLIFVFLLNILVVISILIKQNSAHLPLLLILLLFFFKDKIDPFKRKVLLTSLLLMSVIVVTFILLNIFIYYQSHLLNGLENIYKKPFAILGTILISYFPFPGKDIYSYFIIHKIFAGFLLLALLGIMLWFEYSKNKLININKILFYVIIAALIYFPRILAQSGERLNIIQIMFLSSMILFLFSKKKMFLIIFIGISLLSNLIESQNVLVRFKEGYNYTRKADLALHEMRKYELKENIYVLWRNVWSTTPYSYHFNTMNEFGYDTTIILSEIAAFNINSWLDYSQNVEIIYTYPNYHLISTNNYTYFNVTNKSATQIIETKGSDARGYSEIIFRPNIINENKYNYIYYNDSTRG